MLNWLLRKIHPYQVTLPAEFANKTLALTPLLAIDVELTSLNPSSAEITSIGWVQGQNNRVAMSSCEYTVVKTNASLGQSPVIHGLTHEDVRQGCSIEDVLLPLRARLASRILVFHNAALDLSALDNAFNKLGLPPVDVVYIDTLQLAVYQLKKRHQVLPNNSATLTVCRQRLGLPAVPEHNALDDALATLQLCFAQLYELGLTKDSILTDLSHTKGLGTKTLGTRYTQRSEPD